MKFFALILSILLFISSPSILFAADKMIFSTFPDSDTPNIIIAVKVITEAYNRLGIDIEVKYLPGARAIKMANNGKVDGLLFHNPNLSISFTNLIMINAPIFHSQLVALTKNNRFQINNWNSLKELTTGHIRGFKLVEKRLSGYKTEVLHEIENLIKMLYLNRIDVVVDTYLTCMFTIKKLKLDKSVVTTSLLETFSSFHYLNKKHESLAPKIEKILLEMQKEGIIAKFKQEVLQKIIE